MCEADTMCKAEAPSAFPSPNILRGEPARRHRFKPAGEGAQSPCRGLPYCNPSTYSASCTSRSGVGLSIPSPAS